MTKQVKIGGRRFSLPRSQALRIGIGVVLILGGVLGFLPILGFWMVPLGLIVLSVDLPFVRRWRRQLEVRMFRWWRGNGVNGKNGRNGGTGSNGRNGRPKA